MPKINARQLSALSNHVWGGYSNSGEPPELLRSCIRRGWLEGSESVHIDHDGNEIGRLLFVKLTYAGEGMVLEDCLRVARKRLAAAESEASKQKARIADLEERQGRERDGK